MPGNVAGNVVFAAGGSVPCCGDFTKGNTRLRKQQIQRESRETRARVGETGGHGTGRHAACGAVRMTGRFEGEGGFGGDERQRACREDEANMTRRREDVGELTCGGGRAGLCGAARGREDVGRRGVRRGSRDGRGRRRQRCQQLLSHDAPRGWRATAAARRSGGRAQLMGAAGARGIWPTWRPVSSAFTCSETAPWPSGLLSRCTRRGAIGPKADRRSGRAVARIASELPCGGRRSEQLPPWCQLVNVRPPRHPDHRLH